MYAVTGATKLSPTAVLFSTAEAGEKLLIANGSASVLVVDATGEVTWTGNVCANSVSCSSPCLRVDTAEEATELIAQQWGRRFLNAV